MCFRDLLNELGRRGIEVTESRVRSAIRLGKVTRPPMDGSYRFVFSNKHVAELVKYLKGKDAKNADRVVS